MRTYHLAGAVLAVFALVGLAACGTAQAATTQTVNVTLTDAGVTATPTTFHAGMRYHFVVTNNGTVAHEFLIMPPGMAHAMGQMPMAQWHRQAMQSTGLIGPGVMDSFDYTFATMPMMQQGQGDEFGCYADGYPFKHLQISVQP